MRAAFTKAKAKANITINYKRKNQKKLHVCVIGGLVLNRRDISRGSSMAGMQSGV